MNETAEKMRRLGMDNDASLFEEEPNSPVSFIRSLLEEKNKNDMLGLISLELLQQNITGKCPYILTRYYSIWGLC